MRKILSLLTTILLVGSLWADSPATLSFSAACSGSGTDSDGNSWTVTSDGSESNFDNTKGIHYGTGNAAVQYITLSTSGISGTITQVVVNASTAKNVSATVSVQVGTTNFTTGSPASTTASLSTTATSYTFTGSASGTITVTITKPSSATGALYCKSVEVTYGSTEPSVSVKPTTVAFGDVKQNVAVTPKKFKLIGANLENGLTIAASDGYSVDVTSLTAEEAMDKDSVEITVTPATPTTTGSKPGTITISGEDLENDSTVAITMNVTATFLVQVQCAVKNKSDVAIETPDGIGATINGAASYYADAAGELEIPIEATTIAGYDFINWTVSSANLTVDDEDAASTTASFDAAGTITANFKESSTPTIEVSENALDWGSVAFGTSLTGKTFTITGLNLTANVSLAWDGEGDDAFNYSVTSGSLTPTDGAVNATITVTPKVSAVGSYINELTVSSTGATSQTVGTGLTILQTYTAKWYINSTTTAAQTQTAVAGTALEASPDDFSEFTDCSDLTFMGWAEAPIATKQQSAPTYTSKTEMPEADVNFYAVFADKSVSTTTKTYGFENSEADADYWTIDGPVKTEWANASGTYAGKITTNNTYVTFKNKVNVTNFSFKFARTSDNSNYNVYIETSTDNSVWTAAETYAMSTFSNGSLDSKSKNFDGKTALYVRFHCYNTTAVRYVDDISITYGNITYKDYVTTCPHCETVTLAKAGQTNGTFVFKKNNEEVSSVKTCEATTVNVVATPATGYELTDIELSGVANATYNAGVISIPADATGTLTATATFSAINYTVTMAQTGDASATLSANQTNKHYNDEITITTNEPAGYVFLGWTASPAVEFANAKALETTFNLPNGDVTVTAAFAKLYTVAEAIAKIDENKSATTSNVVVEGYVVESATRNNSAGTLTYSVTDLDVNGFLNEELQFQVYSGNNIGNVNFSKGEGVEIGSKVRVFGDFSYYSSGSLYQINNGNYLISYDEGSLEGVVVYGSATTTIYDAGDSFSTVGLNAKKLWDNGYAEAIAYADVEWAADPATIAANTTSVAVTATYEANTSAAFDVNVTVKTYAITINTPISNGSVGADLATAAKGVTVTLNNSPASGYKLTAYDVYKTGEPATKVEVTDGKFTMPTYAVTVSGSFSEATSVDNIDAEVKAVKVLRDGQIFILRGDKVYTVQGQLVK